MHVVESTLLLNHFKQARTYHLRFLFGFKEKLLNIKSNS